LDDTFQSSPKDKNVIFHLPITKDWIHQFVLSQVLIGHSSVREVIEILDNVFDYQDISIGTIHNIVNNAVQKARFINQTEPLYAVDIGAHDDFHAESKLNELALFLERRAASCTSFRQKMEWKMEKLKRSSDARNLSHKLALARKAEKEWVSLANDIRVLVDWMHNDILSLSGPDLNERRRLYDFVVEELNKRKLLCPHRIVPVCKMLKNHRDNLLAFAGVLDDKFAEIAARFNVPVFLIHAVCVLEGLDRNDAVYWQRRGTLQNKLKDKFNPVEISVSQSMSSTPRAISIVENLNSRLSNSFILRRHIVNSHLDLYLFFLNPHHFDHIDRPYRIVKIPS